MYFEKDVSYLKITRIRLVQIFYGCFFASDSADQAYTNEKPKAPRARERKLPLQDVIVVIPESLHVRFHGIQSHTVCSAVILALYESLQEVLLHGPRNLSLVSADCAFYKEAVETSERLIRNGTKFSYTMLLSVQIRFYSSVLYYSIYNSTSIRLDFQSLISSSCNTEFI